ncbi:MAG: protein kinase domain-containing protein, partial [Candidatus Zixiibacteriota bacterium]
MMLKAGQNFSHFKIIRMLGEGGMGEVYLAEDQKLNRQVALKILQAEFFDNPDRLERFRREAKTAARVSHPNVMGIYDMDMAREEETGRDINYIVMENVPGDSLTNYLKKRSFNTSDVLRLAEKIAAGLAAAHKLNIVHRDIKTDNIKVDDDGNPKILDFGLAKPIDMLFSDDEADTTDTVSRELTQEGKILGTVNYMSPEQARGETVDTRADIFSFGIMFYRMLTGDFPFEGSDKVSIMAKILEAKHTPLRHKNESLPAELERIIDKCLQKDPNDRYQDTRDLVVDIRSLRRQYESGISDSASIVSGSSNAKIKAVTLSGWKLVAAFVFVAAVLALVAFLSGVFNGGESTPGGTVLQARENTLAILGFENKTGDADLDWLQAGLPEILLTDLAQGGAKNIISRNRVLDCLDEKDRLENGLPNHQACIRAAKSIGATTVLSGSFYKMGDKIRIDARLEEVASGKILLGEKVVGVDPFVLVDSLTDKIAQSLNMRLALADKRDVADYTSSSPEAYKHYILGMEKFSLSMLDEAIEEFEKALQYDSTFAMAYLRIGMTYTFKVRNQQGIPYFIKAREREDKLPVKEKNLLDIYIDTWVDNKFDDAFIKLKSFVRSYPDDKEARVIYALFLSEMGNNNRDAIAQLDTVLLLDSKFPMALQNLARLYALDGDYETAIGYALQIKKYYPESPIAYQQLSAFYQDLGRYEEAREVSKEMLEMTPGNIDILQLLIRIYILERDFDNADKYTEMIKQGHADDPYSLITYYGIKENLAYWRGQFKKAGEFQQKQMEYSLVTGDSNYIYLQTHGLASYYNTIMKNKEKALELER